jgi:hypothetical protein
LFYHRIIVDQPLHRGILIMVEEHCLLGCFHGGISYRCLLGLLPCTKSQKAFIITLILCFNLYVRDQVSSPNRTTDKIIVLYVLRFMFLDSR